MIADNFQRGDRLRHDDKTGAVFETTAKNVYVQWDGYKAIDKISRTSPIWLQIALEPAA